MTNKDIPIPWRENTEGGNEVENELNLAIHRQPKRTDTEVENSHPPFHYSFSHWIGPAERTSLLRSWDIPSGC